MSSSAPLDKPLYRFIMKADEAARALEAISQETVIGLDTETYWERDANESRVSLVQIAPRAGEVLVIDVITAGVDMLRPIIESPSVMMAAHNARFDQEMLAGAGLRPAGFVDTLRLARAALRLPSYTLADVSAHLFGIELDKSFQKSNWRRRPLTRAQIEYAALDAYVALYVYEELRRILAEQNRLEQSLRVATLAPFSGEGHVQRPKRRPPEPPPRPLTVEEHQMLVLLKKWRLEKSRDERVAAYMICPDKTLEHLVMERPATLDALNLIYGLGASRVARYGEELLKALGQEPK